MERILLAVALGAVVVLIALLAQRRRPDPPAGRGRSHEAPPQLDRRDFDRPQAPWLVVVFTSSTCSSCADVWAKAQVMASEHVATQQVEATADADLHQRYQIGAVPIVVIADADGVVRSSFLGPVSATHLWAALAELREPGSVPPGCDGADEVAADDSAADDAATD